MVKVGVTIALSAILCMHIGAQESVPQEDGFMTLEQLQEAFFWDFNTPIEVKTVAAGLHVLFGVGGNVGVSIGESGVLIVDDQFPEMVPKINDAIAELGGGEVDFAINTHWHFDHADGNKALGPAGTWIVAHEHSTEMMTSGHVVNLLMMKYRQDAYPEDARPVISFNDRMTFHFNGGDIELVHAGPAHTAGDAAVFFRQQNAVHTGDVFNNQSYPFIDADSGGSIDGMIKFCEVVHAMSNEDTIMIPGHGEITDIARFDAYIEMLKTVRSRVQALKVEGKSLEEVTAANLTADFDESFGGGFPSSGFIDRVYTSLSN